MSWDPDVNYTGTFKAIRMPGGVFYFESGEGLRYIDVLRRLNEIDKRGFLRYKIKANGKLIHPSKLYTAIPDDVQIVMFPVKMEGSGPACDIRLLNGEPSDCGKHEYLDENCRDCAMYTRYLHLIEHAYMIKEKHLKEEDLD